MYFFNYKLLKVIDNVNYQYNHISLQTKLGF